MDINSDINILGSISDENLIEFLMNNRLLSNKNESQYNANFKTFKSFRRFENAVLNTLLYFYNSQIKDLIINLLNSEGVSRMSLHFIFLNASYNNALINYINTNVYFPALYNGRSSLMDDEIISCLKDLKNSEISLQKWSDSTVKITASKYLTLLRKFNLMEGSAKKTIPMHLVNDKEFILFVYWIISVENQTNLLESPWIQYSFMEKEIFLQQVMQKKFIRYWNVVFTGDKLKIENNYSYEEIVHEISK